MYLKNTEKELIAEYKNGLKESNTDKEKGNIS
jgi:hypothetical protein